MPLTISERTLLELLNRCLPELEAARSWAGGEWLERISELVGQLKVVIALGKGQTIARPVPVCPDCKRSLTEYHGVPSPNLPRTRMWYCECSVDEDGLFIRPFVKKVGR